MVLAFSFFMSNMEIIMGPRGDREFRLSEFCL